MNSNDGSRSSLRLPVSPRGVTYGLLIMVVILTLASATGQLVALTWGFDPDDGLVRYLNVDREMNLPTWYSASALVLASLLLGLIAADHGVPTQDRVNWAGLAVIFTGLSLDETTALHERTAEPVRQLLHADRFFPLWIIPGVLFVLVVGLVCLPFMRRLPRATRRRFLVAGAIFVVGAVVIELFGGIHASLHGKANGWYVALATVEEHLEMLGVVLFIRALLIFITQRTTEKGSPLTRAVNKSISHAEHGEYAWTS
jgi:hypothetical protein